MQGGEIIKNNNCIMNPEEIVPEVPVEEVAETPAEEVPAEEVAETPAEEEAAEEVAPEVAETPAEEEAAEEVAPEVAETPVADVPQLMFAGQVVVADGIRTVVGSGAEVHHLKLADGSEVDASDEEYAAAVEASK